MGSPRPPTIVIAGVAMILVNSLRICLFVWS